MPRGKTKKFECPICEGRMSKRATTCMSCYRRGYGKSNDSSPHVNPRFNEDIRKKWRDRVEELKRENVIKMRK